jgi:diadenosine tetraphosphatase ApaH/serine/threonine PP2A family protein phosphatase
VIGVLYDIHGNLPALEAVLADARAAGARRFMLGGDYALFGAWPAETLDALRELDAEWIRGNGERWCARPDDEDVPEAVAGAIERCRELLGEAELQRLGALPEQLVREGIRFCHASPLSDVRGFAPIAEDSDAELLAGANEGLVVFGHTHVQFERRGPGGADLVNPGSVGMPFDGDHRAAYALLRPDGEVELRRVAYDHAASVAAVRERLGAAGEIPARRIELARFDV